MRQLKIVIAVSMLYFAGFMGAVLFGGGKVPASSAENETQELVQTAEQELAVKENAPVVPAPNTALAQPQEQSRPLPAAEAPVPAAPASGNAAKPAANPPATTTTQPPPTTTAAPPPPPDNRCIVTIKGLKYDVTRLRSSHSGGDVFNCGTDMTSTFFSQHDQKMLDRDMARYRIN